MNPRWTNLATLVADVAPESRLGVGGFHFTRTPVAALLALPKSARDLHYVAWGGGLSLEILLARELVHQVTLCFSSLDVFGPAPRFRRAVETGTLTLHEWTALGMIAALRAAGENLPFGTFQDPAGSSLAPEFSTEIASPVGTGDVPVRAVPALDLDVLLLHAHRADDDGNVEIAGARGLDMSMIFAAKRVLVTVDERVPRRQFAAPRSFILPRTFVHALALTPDGAYPTASLPAYPADYRALGAFAAASDDVEALAALTPPPDRLARLRRRARCDVRELTGRMRKQPAAQPPTAAWTTDEIMVTTIAATIEPGAVCSVGSASPLPTAAYLLAKHTGVRDLLLMSHNGGLVDPGDRPLSLSAGEMLDHQLAAAHTGGDETYHWYYQRGLVTHEVVGTAQVDATGATNNRTVRRRDGSMVRLPGQGGMADVANLHANFILYLPRQSPRNTPERVETTSAARAWHDAAQRRGYGLAAGRMLVITDLAVFTYRDGALQVTSLHPGVSLEQLQEQTGFELRVAPDLGTTTEPSAEQLRLLRTVIDPLGVRRLDLVAATDRHHLITQILDHEDTLFDTLELS